MPASARELLRRYRERELLPSDAVARSRERWEARQGTVGAFAATRWEEALAEARKHDRAYRRGAPRGPLAGLPVAVKDLLDTADCATEYGSAILRDTCRGATRRRLRRCARRAPSSSVRPSPTSSPGASPR